MRRVGISSLLVLAACGTQGDTPTEAERSPSVTMAGDTAILELPVGRSADNGELSVSFDGVSEDSRCPTDVQCVWEGNASIRLTVASGGATAVFILSSTLEPRSASFAGYSIGFRDLSPYPVAAAPTDTSSYVARIAVFDTR